MGGFRSLIRRWVPLLYLIPLSYFLKPLVWTPLDHRFYNYFHAKRDISKWVDVLVVGVDGETVEKAFGRPAFPLSRHVEKHAEVVAKLHEAGARAIVLDFELSSELFDSSPEVLANSIDSAGNVYLIKQVLTEHRISPSGIEMVSTREKLPDRMLVDRSRGAFIAHSVLDSDGRFRRYSTFSDVFGNRYVSIPEILSGISGPASFPVEVPSEKEPMPVISYLDVLEGKADVAGEIAGKIVFVGAIIGSSLDRVSIARSTILPGGHVTREIPGVIALAAITENLIKGGPIRDANWLETLLWVVFWCLLGVSLMPRLHPVVSATFLIAVCAVAMVVTGVMHIYADKVYPAGLLLGSLFISGVFTIISLDIQTTRELLMEEAENRSIRRDIELARKTQTAFLPEIIPQVEGADIWGVNISSKGVSGDYFDVISRDGEESLVIAIGDVSGKGMPASLIMSNVQAGLHSQLLTEATDLVDITTNLNFLIFENTEESAFVTFFIAQLLLDPLRLECVRAGHEKPVVVSAGGAVRELQEGGLALGIFPDSRYSSYESSLDCGDVFCLYTDGVTEARSLDGKWFEKERLFDVLVDNRGKNAKSIVEAVVREVREFSGVDKQADDITLVVIRIDDKPDES